MRPPGAGRGLPGRPAVRSRVSGLFQAPAAPRPTAAPPAAPALLPQCRHSGRDGGRDRRAPAGTAQPSIPPISPLPWPPHGTASALAFTLGQFLASRSPDLAVLHENAMPAWALVIDAMDAAPSLPDGVHGLGLDTVPDADPALIVLAHQGVLDLTLALNSLLPQVSRARDQRRRPRRGHEVHGPVRRAGRLLHRRAQDDSWTRQAGRPAARSTVIRTRSRRTGHAPASPAAPAGHDASREAPEDS